MAEWESDEGRPLTEKEISELRHLIERENRVLWFWGSIRVWAMWISAVAAAVYVAVQGFKDLVRWAFSSTGAGG